MTSASVFKDRVKSGEIFAEATMDQGPKRSVIDEEEENYRQSFARHVASRTKVNIASAPLCTLSWDQSQLQSPFVLNQIWLN